MPDLWKSDLFPNDGPNAWTICERSIPVVPGAECTVVRFAEPDMPPFRVGTLLVPDDIAPHFALNSMRFGVVEQLAMPGCDVPCAMFDSRQPFDLRSGVPLLIVAALLPALDVALRVRNISDETRTFSAKFLGWSVQR